MDKTLRNILWVLVALVLLSSFSTGWFFVAKEKLYNDYTALGTLFKTTTERLNRELASSRKESIELRAKLEEVKNELNILEAKGKDLKSKYEALLGERDDLNRELARVKRGKFFLESKVKDMESRMFVADLLKDKALLEVELKRLKGSLAPKDSKIEELKAENSSLNNELSKVGEEKSLLEQKLKDSKEVAQLLSRDLMKEKNKDEEQKIEFKNAKIENRLLKFRVAELEKITGRSNKLLAEKESMGLKIASLKRELEYKNYEIDKMRVVLETSKKAREPEPRAEAYHSPAEVELPPIVLQRDDRTATKFSSSPLERMNNELALKGRIVTVNREHNFVVIDLGRQDGIDIGTRFKVYRDNLFIGSLEVIQTRERIAACDIKDVKEGFSIETDDAVIKQ